MEAFKNGAGFGAAELALMIAGVGCVAILLCAAWMMLSAWWGYSGDRVKGRTLGIVIAKSLLLVLLFFWIFL